MGNINTTGPNEAVVISGKLACRFAICSFLLFLILAADCRQHSFSQFDTDHISNTEHFVYICVDVVLWYIHLKTKMLSV